MVFLVLAGSGGLADFIFYDNFADLACFGGLINVDA